MGGDVSCVRRRHVIFQFRIALVIHRTNMRVGKHSALVSLLSRPSDVLLAFHQGMGRFDVFFKLLPFFDDIDWLLNTFPLGFR